MDLSDAELVRQAQSGHTEAFGCLVERYKNAAYGTAYTRVHSFSDAQDIAQEAFILTYQKLVDLRQPERFGNWLYRIVCNLCHNHLRMQKATKPFDETQSPNLPDPSSEHDRRALHRRIQRAISALSEIHRETVTLHYMQGYSVDETAAFLNVPPGTVKRRLSDARQKLKEEMIDMARDLFDAHPLPENFQKVIAESVDPEVKMEQAKLYVRAHNQRGFVVEITGHQQLYISSVLTNAQFLRPITYDFIRDLCKGFQIDLDCVTITQNEKALVAELIFARGKTKVTLSTFPGYAFALAMAFAAPVYADESLLKKMQARIPKTQPEKEKFLWEINVTPQQNWATFEETDGKPDCVRMALHIRQRPQEPEKVPSRRSRLRRLATADLITVDVARAEAEEDNPKYPMIWLATRPKRVFLPIAIGDYEASAIATVLPKNKVNLIDRQDVRERGHIYDLLKEVLRNFQITCEHIVIDLLHSTTFYALANFQRGKKQIRFDARPSDAIALALRFGAEIAVEKGVLDLVGVDHPDVLKKKAPQAVGQGSPMQKSLSVGGKAKLTLKSRRKFVWESTDPNVAQVSQEGVVQTLKAGDVEIVATWKKKQST